MRKIIYISTTKKREIIDLTEKVQAMIGESKLTDATCLLFVKHTTASLTTGEIGENTPQDFLNFIEKIIPQMDFQHTHDPKHAPDHMIATLMGPSLNIPVENGKLSLGTWQRIYLVELDGPKERSVVLDIIAQT